MPAFQTRQWPVKRSNRVPMPTAWLALCHEWWGVEQGLTWAVWQALSSCEWSEVKAFRQQLLLWPTVASGLEAARSHGLTPPQVLRIIELLVTNSRLARAEAAVVEEALLRHVRHGQWKG